MKMLNLEIDRWDLLSSSVSDTESELFTQDIVTTLENISTPNTSPSDLYDINDHQYIS